MTQIERLVLRMIFRKNYCLLITRDSKRWDSFKPNRAAAVKGRLEEAEEAMRNRSTIDMIVEDAVRELEYELESESRPPLPKLYKWMVYTSTSMSGDWRCNREDSPQRMMQLTEAKNYGEALLKRLAPIVAPLDLRVGFQRYVWDGKAWKLDLGQCRQIEILTNRISACDGVPPKNC